jgi:glycosyltransferase involved in cell wall biosynthesis
LGRSCAGLSLLHDLPNYRHSQPSKVIDYLAHGVPVVTTPLPLARELVECSGGGLVVPHDDSAAAADAVRRLAGDPALRHRLGSAGRAYAREHLDWGRAAEAFVSALADVAASGAAPGGSSAGSPRPSSGA